MQDRLELMRELRSLAQRIARIEQRLGMSGQPATTAAGQRPTEPEAPPIIASADIGSPALRAAPPSAPGSENQGGSEKARAFAQMQARWLREQQEESSHAPAGPPTAPPIAPPIAATGTAPPTAPARSFWDEDAPAGAPALSLEQLIGGKFMAWVGALIVLLAAVFAIKIGIDHGLWGRVAPQIRCIIIAGFGAVLLAVGELALRRIGRAASVGLFGAGLGVLYLDAFATFQHFHLLGRQGAFVLMAIVAVGGFAITLRTRFLTIGVLSIVGGYLTPILLRGDPGHDLELLTFLTILLGISLALSATVPRAFRPLRYVAVAMHMLLAFVWLAGGGWRHWQLAMIFMSGWWGMTMAEAVYAAMRRQSALGNVALCLLVGAAYVTGGCWVLSGAAAGTSPWLGAFTGSIALLCAAIALQFGPGIESLRQPPRSAMDKLAVTLWAQAGVLLVVAIAMQFDDFAQSIAWLAVALASVEVGRRLPSRGVTWFGLIVLAVALLHIAVPMYWTGGMSKPIQGWESAYIRISPWSLLALAAIVVMHIAAHRVMHGAYGVWRTMPPLLAALASAGWLLLWAIQGTYLGTTAMWLVGAVALLAMHRFGERQRYFEIGLGVLGWAALRWAIIDSVVANSSDRFTPQTPLLNAYMAMGAAIAAAAIWAYRIAQTRGRAKASDDVETGLPRRIAITDWLPVASAILMLIGLSLEIVRTLDQMTNVPGWLAPWPAMHARELLLMALWAAGGVAMAMVGKLTMIRPLQIVGTFSIFIAAFLWLSLGTLGRRVHEGVVDAAPVLNLQFAVGALLAASLAGVWFILRRLLLMDAEHAPPATNQPRAIDSLAQAPMTALALIAAIGLWLGSFEIDRALALEPMVRHASLSVYWGLYGAMMVVIGFAYRAAPARYVGLTLLSITVAKVLIVDFSALDDLPRVISTLVAGLLLIGTSAVYIKLAPRLLERS